MSGYRRLILAGQLLCGIGLLVSGYLTFEHFTGSTTLLCTDSGAVNCQKVTTSQWAYAFGIPVALLGLGYFLVMTTLWVMDRSGVGRLRVVWGLLGMVFVGYLVYAELMWLHAICSWCTVVHVITFLLVVLAMLAEIYRPLPDTYAPA